MKTLIRVIVIAIIFVFLSGCNSGNEAETVIASEPAITAEQARETAASAYVYGFPMVMVYKTMYAYSIDENSPEYKGPFNQKFCEARLYTPDDRAVVTPNSDTPYCMFWMDLRAEPLVLTVPEVDPDRFYHFQFVDLYSHNFAYVGTLSTGNSAGSYLISGPDWNGELPEGIDAVIQSETNFVFPVVRTQLMSPEDLQNVEAIQDSYGLQLLSDFQGTKAPTAPVLPEFPVWVEGSQFDERFFAYLDFMMSLLKTPGAGEHALWDELASLGIGPDNSFDYAALSTELQEAMKAGVKDGFAQIELFNQQNGADPLASAKIFGTREFLSDSASTNYGLESLALPRAVAAHMGLFGNSAFEAIYPTYQTDSDNKPLNASANDYFLTFEEGDLPPVNSFWSLSMYDAKTQLFIHNPLNRYLLNSTMMDQFTLGDDGSLILYISKESPGTEFEGNWLPAPDGPFYMVLRLYGPKDEALEGEWTPPAISLRN